jgi:hypothetical protein
VACAVQLPRASRGVCVGFKSVRSACAECGGGNLVGSGDKPALCCMVRHKRGACAATLLLSDGLGLMGATCGWLLLLLTWPSPPFAW